MDWERQEFVRLLVLFTLENENKVSENWKRAVIEFIARSNGWYE